MAADFPRARSGPRAPSRWWWVVAWLVATACVGWAGSSIDWRAALVRLQTARPGWIAFAVLAHCAVLLFLTEQWTRLLPRPVRFGWRAMWECVTISMAAMNTLPFGGGHAVAVGLRTARGATLQEAVLLLALVQRCVAVARVSLVLLAFAVAPLPGPWREAGWLMAAGVSAGFGGLWWLARRPAPGTWLGRWRETWALHLAAARRPRVLGAAIGLSLLGKTAMLLAVYAVQRALGVHLPLASVPVVLVAVTVATLIALSPGSVGVYELAAIAAYRIFGVSPELALVLALMQHACFLLPNIGVGYGVLAWRALRGGARHRT